MDESVFVYSLAKIAEGRASLVNIIELQKVFKDYQKEHYQDFVTSIFRNAEKQDFSTQIFEKDGDTKSNVLLKVQNIKERLAFFNNNCLRVTRFEFNPKGLTLILLADGRAVVLDNKRWAGSEFKIINLNEVTKEKIIQACFVGNEGACLVTKEKIFLISDLNDKSKVITHRNTITGISQCYGTLFKDRTMIYLTTSKELHIIEYKKKLLQAKLIKFQQYISQSYFFNDLIFIITTHDLHKIQLHTLINTTLQSYKTPMELVHMDRFGNYIAKGKNNCKESLWLVESTTNGIFVAQTIRRNGNYKEGRLVIFQPDINYFLKRLIANVKDPQGYVNLKDAIFVNLNKPNKDILQQFSNLSKGVSLTYNNTQLSFQEYNAVCINLAHSFQGKQSKKQKIIQRSLQNRYQRHSLSSKRYDYSQLTLRCCYSGRQLNDQQLNWCKSCDLYCLAKEGNRCVVCHCKMQKYE